MWMITKFLAVYIIGGLTFVPFVIVAVLLHFYLTAPTRSEGEDDNAYQLRTREDDEHSLSSDSALLKKLSKAKKGSDSDVAAGYFAVCREFVPGGINGKPPERTTPTGAVVPVENPTILQGVYQRFFDKNKSSSSIDSKDGNKKQVRRARNVFYVVLR
jgi:hypothetical protein